MMMKVATLLAVAALAHVEGRNATYAEGPKIVTDGKDMRLQPPKGGTVRFATGKQVVSVDDLLQADVELADAIAMAADAQANFSDSTDKKLKALQATIDTELAVKINNLETKLAKKVDDNTQKLAEGLQKQTAAVKKVKDDANKMLATKADKKYTYTKTETDEKIKNRYCVAPPKGFSPIKGAEADVKAGRIFVGMMFVGNSEQLCGSKATYLTTQTIYCTTALRYCSNPTYCPSQVKPQCGKCMGGCEKCRDSKTCETCSNGAYFSSQCGKCKHASSCYQLKKAGILTKDGVHQVKLLSKKGGKSVDARCVLDGNHAHTHIQCEKFEGKCNVFTRFYQSNTCQKFGYQITPFRTRKEFQLAYDSKAYGKTLINKHHQRMAVYKTGGGGRYTHCPMRSWSSGSCAQWRVPDGRQWWLRDSTYGEPNGDYTSYCHLPGSVSSRTAGFNFNDHNCNYNSGSFYRCGTNDYDGQGYSGEKC